MREIIKNINFPQNDMLESHYKLYYRGTKGVLLTEDEDKKLLLPEFQVIEFNTYLNGCSIAKWIKYTSLEEIFLELTVQGHFVLKIYAYSLKAVEPERRLINEVDINLPQKENIQISIPLVEDQMVGFEVHTMSPTTLWQGQYQGIFSDSREVNLAISTTT